LLPLLNVRTDLRDLVRAEIEPFDVGYGEEAFGDLGQLVLGDVDVFKVNQTFQVDWNVGEVPLRVPHVEGTQLGKGWQGTDL